MGNSDDGRADRLKRGVNCGSGRAEWIPEAVAGQLCVVCLVVSSAFLSAKMCCEDDGRCGKWSIPIEVTGMQSKDHLAGVPLGVFMYCDG